MVINRCTNRESRWYGCRIENPRLDRWGQAIADLVKPDGTTIPLEGTWAFTPGISYSAPTGHISDNGFVCQEYITIGGHWQ